jgi:hypothetical protein
MSRAEDRHENLCPVSGCTNEREDANGILCWRHRQFVRPAAIKAIKQAWSTLQRNTGTVLEDECRGDLSRTVNAACAEALNNVAAIKASQGRSQ